MTQQVDLLALLDQAQAEQRKLENEIQRLKAYYAEAIRDIEERNTEIERLRAQIEARDVIVHAYLEMRDATAPPAAPERKHLHTAIFVAEEEQA